MGSYFYTEPKEPCPELPPEIWEKIIGFVVGGYCPPYKDGYVKKRPLGYLIYNGIEPAYVAAHGGYNELSSQKAKIAYVSNIMEMKYHILPLLQTSKMIHMIIHNHAVWQNVYFIFHVSFRLQIDSDDDDMSVARCIRLCRIE